MSQSTKRKPRQITQSPRPTQRREEKFFEAERLRHMHLKQFPEVWDDVEKLENHDPASCGHIEALGIPRLQAPRNASISLEKLDCSEVCLPKAFPTVTGMRPLGNDIRFRQSMAIIVGRMVRICGRPWNWKRGRLS